MPKCNIGSEIIAGIEEIKAWRRGEVKLRTFSVELPRAAYVPHIRRSLGFSQPEFALFMGVSVATLHNWEQQRREPHGPARSLLLVAAKRPAAVRETFKSTASSPTKKAFSKVRASSKTRRFPKSVRIGKE